MPDVDPPVVNGRTSSLPIGGAPISWGACEVPGWGPMPMAEPVLAEMAALGLSGTELGPPGFLEPEPTALAAQLRRHGLRLIGAFTPLALHDPDRAETARHARAAIERLARAGGEVLIVAAVQDLDWSTPGRLDDAEWERLGECAGEISALAAEHGVGFALHPHVGTVIETAEQIARAVDQTEVGFCLDTGHLTIGGADPAAFAAEHGDRVTHVHLKDVDAALAARVRAGELDLMNATRAGLFRPLGDGDAPLLETLTALHERRYHGWLVLEQDTTIAADEPAADRAPMVDATKSIAFLNSAHNTEEINR